MNPFKKLAGQTAIYGLPTIIGRLLNYFLVPLLTYKFSNPSDFGINTLFYSYISFLNIVFTYGMETALFNFSVTEPNKAKVYSTAIISVCISTFIFTAPLIVFSGDLSAIIHHPYSRSFIIWSALIIATDALVAVPFAKLREEKKSVTFAAIKSVNIVVNIFLTIFFIGFCKTVYDHHSWGYEWVEKIYNPEIGIGYAFISNLIANGITVLIFFPHFRKVNYHFDPLLWKRMMVYALPLLVVGLAGMTNETMDRILLERLLPKDIAMRQVGIYGACYKIAIIMTVFIQAFRYAAEPFFFSHSKQQDAKKTYADVMKYFVIICAFIFLATTMNLEWIKYFVNENYWDGLRVVPILLMANLCLGVFYNLSIWYKLTNKTRLGAYITAVGAIITILLNVIWIPSSGYFAGYMGSAWATLICYFSMMLVSYFIGQKHYPVNYQVGKILSYVLLALTLYGLSEWLNTNLLVNNLLLFLFLVLAFLLEKSTWSRVKANN